jgi:ATP phosphoribosyltransferase regulatory subunit HisZ
MLTGYGHPNADVECIALAVELLRNTGLLKYTKVMNFLLTHE